MTVWTEKLKTNQKEHKCLNKEAMIKCSSGLTKKRPKTIKEKKSQRKILTKFGVNLKWNLKGKGLV